MYKVHYGVPSITPEFQNFEDAQAFVVDISLLYSLVVQDTSSQAVEFFRDARNAANTADSSKDFIYQQEGFDTYFSITEKTS